MVSSDPDRAELLTDASRAVIGTVFYAVKFEKLDDVLVDRQARALIEEPLREFTAADEYQAIVDALWSDVRLTEVIELPEFIPKPHTEQEFRDFLRRLLERLDAMRPWPEPLHRALDDTRWDGYQNARVIGRITMRYVDAQDRLKYVFRTVDDAGRKIHVLILRLKSGDEVALAAPWWPDSKHVAVLSRSPERSPEQVLAALFDGTGFRPEDVVPVAPEHPVNSLET